MNEWISSSARVIKKNLKKRNIYKSLLRTKKLQEKYPKIKKKKIRAEVEMAKEKMKVLVKKVYNFNYKFLCVL